MQEPQSGQTTNVMPFDWVWNLTGHGSASHSLLAWQFRLFSIIRAAGLPYIYPHWKFGVVAQLGERRVRNAKVRGSNPLGSTTPFNMDSRRVGKLVSLSDLRGLLMWIGGCLVRDFINLRAEVAKFL